MLAVAVAVEGDSLAWQMRPALERRLRVETYDATIGMMVRPGVDRILARRVAGKVVLVSLGTNDARANPLVTTRGVAHDARRLARVARCVVWSRVRIAQPGFARQQRIVNRGLERVRSLHLIRPPPPDFGDGVHFSPRNARVLAARFAYKAVHDCGATRLTSPP